MKKNYYNIINLDASGANFDHRKVFRLKDRDIGAQRLNSKKKLGKYRTRVWIGFIVIIYQ